VFKKTLRRHLEKLFPPQDLARWFDPLHLQKDEENHVIRVFFPHAYFRSWFLEAVREDFEKQAQDLAGDIAFLYESTGCPGAERAAACSEAHRPGANCPAAPGRPDQTSRARPSLENSPSGPDNEKSFDNFLVNRKNIFPLNAAKKSCALAAAGGSLPYNPIVFYGPSGSGKSHLLAAVCAWLRHKGLAVRLGDVNLLDSMRLSPGRYSQPAEHCLCLDDAQRVSACPDLQEALAALVDLCESSGKLLVLAFERHPATMTSLKQNVKSRLAGGLAAELKRPDLDVRLQYAQLVNERLKLGLSREQLLTLCQRYTDIRGINGLLTSFSAMHALGDAPSTASLDEMLPSSLPVKNNLTAAGIIQTTAAHFNISPEDLTGKKRDKKLAFPRHAAIYLCRELLGLSLARTGALFGNRDHSSVLYSIKKISSIRESNKDGNMIVENLRQMCLNGP
ncbi:hypothetical protein LJC15_04620, partial [Desulfovibrio sp. OttesenSCG-928-G11]|nr:hypothetical protein [Desulfovibrio sp. OttesenSCG-928-G11]